MRAIFEPAQTGAERRIWRFIKEHRDRSAAEGIPRSASGATTEAQRRESREAPAARRGTRDDRPLPLHLGFGQDDRFAHSHRLMATALDSASVDVVPGGHEWQAWRRLWENFLDMKFSRNGTAA